MTNAPMFFKNVAYVYSIHILLLNPIPPPSPTIAFMQYPHSLRSTTSTQFYNLGVVSPTTFKNA